MSVNVDALGTELGARSFSWNSKDALLYAIGVGAGASDPHAELAFTTENSHAVAQQVLPTFAIVVGTDAEGDPEESDLFTKLGDFSLAQILHGGQRVVLHETLPVSATGTTSGRVTGIYDKGRNAVVETTSELRDAGDGRLLAEIVSTLFIRGEGGFGGDPGVTTPWTRPDREPDATLRYSTRPDQALLYRLSGDRNPLHSDPWFAKMAGFDRPVLHGLCTYGFTGRALLHELCDGDPAAFGSMDGRFASMVLPGDVLDVAIWRTDDGALFQTSVDGRVVLDRGMFSRRG